MELVGVPVDTKLIPQLQKELEADCFRISEEASIDLPFYFFTIFCLIFFFFFSEKIRGAKGVLISSPLQVREALFRSILMHFPSFFGQEL